jgi:hypothetical protein
VKRRKIPGRGSAVAQTARTVSEPRPAEFWQGMEAYNRLAATERAAHLGLLGISAGSSDILGMLTKSHFVIPGKTRFECQRCGECCRYARKVATFTY